MNKASKFVIGLIIGLIIFGMAGCQFSLQQKKAVTEKEESSTDKLHSDAQLLDGSELDMSKLGEDEKYVVARTIYKNLEKNYEFISEEYQYNKYGKKSRKISYGQEGKVIKEYIWKYDEQGNLRKKIIKGDTHTSIYHYNQDGKLKKFCSKDKAGKVVSSLDYKYWENGNVKYKRRRYFSGKLEETFYNQQGEPKKGKVITREGKKLRFGYKIFHYKNGNKKEKIKAKVHKDKVIGLEVTKYNKQGLKIKLKDYELENNEKQIKGWYEWKYSRKGNKIKTIIKNKDGKIIEKDKYKYDKRGRKIAKKEYETNKDGKLALDLWTIYNYNKHGHLLAKKVKSTEGKVLTMVKNKFKKIKRKKGK